MSLRIANVTFDCTEPAKVARFWSAVLDRPLAPDANEFFALVPPADDASGVPTLLFLKVPEPRTAKNRVHLDLATDDREGEVARVLTLGATRVHDNDEYGVRWTTLQDPEGNELCIAEHPAGH
jgi:hypothetical protein